LLPDASGDDLVVTQIDASLPAAQLWKMLSDPHTFSH
jgi:hypothetical protein